MEDVDALYRHALTLGLPNAGTPRFDAVEDKPWGMYEFTLSDPDQTLVRVGWPTRLRTPR